MTLSRADHGTAAVPSNGDLLLLSFGMVRPENTSARVLGRFLDKTSCQSGAILNEGNWKASTYGSKEGNENAVL